MIDLASVGDRREGGARWRWTEGSNAGVDSVEARGLDANMGVPGCCLMIPFSFLFSLFSTVVVTSFLNHFGRNP